MKSHGPLADAQGPRAQAVVAVEPGEQLLDQPAGKGTLVQRSALDPTEDLPRPGVGEAVFEGLARHLGDLPSRAKVRKPLAVAARTWLPGEAPG
jgi:hypothetical protein